MATTNWSKVERLNLELRVGLATRLMDRLPYAACRSWLTEQGVLEEALPSDRSMHGYTDTLEYSCLLQQRLDRHPELAGGAEPDPASMGLEACGGALSPAGFMASARRWLTIRLRVAEQTYKVYDHAAMMADRHEERLLMEIEAACQHAEDDAEAPTAARAAASDAETNTNKESPVWANAKGMERLLLESAAKLPGVDPEDLQREALWMHRRNRLERDPRMLKPAAFSRLMSQMMRMMRESDATPATAASPVVAATRPVATQQPAGFGTDSAAFGASTQRPQTTAPASMPKPAQAARQERPTGQPAPRPAQPAGFGTDSAAFGASTQRPQATAPASMPKPAPAARQERPTGQPAPRPAQPAGFGTDSAAFGASAFGVGAAPRSSLDPAYLARARATGLSIEQAMWLHRHSQIPGDSTGSKGPDSALDYLERTRRTPAPAKVG